MTMLLAPFRLIVRVAQRFQSERCAQTAAALSFTTVLGLVPMIAATVMIISLLPFGGALSQDVERFMLANLLPDKAGAVIAKYVAQFAHKANQLSLFGAAVLAVTAIAQMLTIEHAFNVIWKIKASRPFWRRILMHAIALAFGPLLFGASLAAITYLVTVSLGHVQEPPWVTTFMVHGVPFLFMVGIFGLLYLLVPNRDVLKRHALIGGMFAAACFAAMQKLFTLYLSLFSSYSVIYGTFSAVPTFLLWLYMSWTIVLIGAYVVAELPRASQA